MRLLIFKPGTWNGRKYSKDFCSAIVANYDPHRGVEAPIVVGHRGGWEGRNDEFEFAHGWVSALEVDASGQVFATIPEPTPDLVGWIQTKKLRYVSVEMSFDLNEKQEPVNPQLIRVAALGRSIPAVPTTRIKASFSATRGDLLIQDTDDGVFAAFGRLVSDGLEQNPTTEEESMGHETGQGASTETVETLQAKLAATEHENAELKAEKRKSDSVSFMDTVGGSGLPPAVKDAAVELDVQLSDEQRKSFRAFLSSLAPVVTLGKTHVATDPGPKTAHANLSAQIRAYQKKHDLDTFAAAMEALRAENPGLFTDAGGGIDDSDDENGGDAA